MNIEALALAVRAQSNALHEMAYDKQEEIPTDLYRLARDCAELGRTLARVIDGAPVARAFGSPGDWGYSHPIGKALAAAADGVRGSSNDQPKEPK